MRKTLITLIVLIATTMCVQAESLFSLGATQNYMGTPKSLFGGVQARNVGDLITIIMDERVSMSDNLSYDSSKETKTVDNFTHVLNQLFGIKWFKPMNQYGGSNEVTNGSKTTRQMVFGDNVAVQVIQQTPNGNLMVQGKKILVNGNERMDLIVTGVVDPRWINASGQIYSKNVANLQFALSGRGSAARTQNEGIINRAIRYLF